jgi:hypothetical protein
MYIFALLLNYYLDMKIKNLSIYCFIALLIACNKIVPSKDVTVTEFPATKELKATVMQTDPVILDPDGIFIVNSQIWVIQNKKDTLFDVFNLYDGKYLYSTGIKGGGPDDFIFPQAQTIQVEDDKFTILDRFMLKTMEVQPSGSLRTVKRERIFDMATLNGFLKINDSLFCTFADCLTGADGDFEFEFLLKNISSGKEIKFSKYPDLTVQKFQGDQKCFIYNKYPVANSSRGIFATFYGYFKFARFYSINNGVLELEKELHVNIEPYSTDNIDNWEKRNIYYSKPVATDKYIYVPCSDNEIQVWDWEGNPIMQYFIDIDFSAFTISEKLNKLYAVQYTDDDESIDKIYVYDLN